MTVNKSDRQRVAFVTPSFLPRPGGLAIAAHRITRALAEMGWEIHVVTPVPEDGAASVRIATEAVDGIVIHRFYLDLARYALLPSWSSVLAEIDRTAPFRLFHAFFLSATYPCVRVARNRHSLVRRPILASIRGSDSQFLNDSAVWPLVRYCLRQSDWITSVNREYLEWFRPHIDIEGCSSTIYNGVQKSAGSWTLTRANWGVIGTLGQFRRVKNIPLLVLAFASLGEAERKQLRLGGYFIDARDEEWVNTLAAELEIRDKLHTTGHLPHSCIGDFLEGIHVYVQPSSAEGMPNSLLEAAAAGVPIVATAVGGVREIFTDNRNALLVPSGDLRGMARAIQRLIYDSGLSQSLGERARALATSLSTTWEAREWDDLYSMLLRKAAVPACRYPSTVAVTGELQDVAE